MNTLATTETGHPIQTSCTRRLKSFGVCRTPLRTFYDEVRESAIFYADVCWGCGSSERDRKRLHKLVRNAASILTCSLDLIKEGDKRRMLATLTSIRGNSSHPLHKTLRALSSSFSNRLVHSLCKTEDDHKTSIKLYNSRVN